jgi:HEAT repeat protein
MVAVTIDAGGDDTYDGGDSRYAQGFGCLSVGVLVDFAGNDRYLAGNMAQGSGLFGIGVLADYHGKDEYRMGMLGQGFGLFGLGVLLDTGSEDKYIINGLGQGAGSTMGFGVLCDTSGNDKYLASPDKKRGWLLPDDLSHAQGAGLSIRSPAWHRNFSFYGGIGFLTDGGGNDFYYASHGNCMGSSYFMSVGALVDASGDDKYWPDEGWGIASAVHLSGAVLIDRGGNDTYYGKFHSGGAASDRSIAILADYAGDDTYGPNETFVQQLLKQRNPQQFESLGEAEKKQKIRENMARASYAVAMKPKSLALLVDYLGDDSYFASPVERKESCGGIVPPTEPQSWSHAILLDLGGVDFYSKTGRKNNHYYKYLNHGLCYDTDYSGNQVIGKTPLSTGVNHRELVESAQATTKKGTSLVELSALFDADLFVRFAAIGKILRSDSAVVPQLFKILNTSTDSELNRDVIEILDTLILSGNLKPSHFKQFVALLDSKDSFVQVFAARILAHRPVNDAHSALIRVSRHENKTVRAQVIRTMGRIGSPIFTETLTAAALNDSSRQCRDAAIIALTRYISGANGSDSTRYPTILETLTKSLEDPDESVRTSAAQSLRYFGNIPTVRQALQKMLDDKSVYVQRAAAKSLIINGDKAAIPRLIATLTFPSIDTFAFYDHEIVKDLAFYCGIDFPENERYAHATWNKWWQENGAEVNLAQNLKIMRAIESAFSASSEEEGMAIFERLLAEHPGNIVIRKRYIRFCNEWINMRLLTRARIGKEIYGRSLRLQHKLIQLEPDSAERWVRLAYFNYRLGEINDAVIAMQTALKIAPDNSSNRQTLNHYRELMQKKNK